MRRREGCDGGRRGEGLDPPDEFETITTTYEVLKAYQPQVKTPKTEEPLPDLNEVAGRTSANFGVRATGFGRGSPSVARVVELVARSAAMKV